MIRTTQQFHMVHICFISFKFVIHVINDEINLWQKFCSKWANFQPLEGSQSWQQRNGFHDCFLQQHMFVGCIYLFGIHLLALTFGSYVVNIENFFIPKFHGCSKKKLNLNPWEVVKVSSNEKFSQLNMLVDFSLIFGESFDL